MTVFSYTIHRTKRSYYKVVVCVMLFVRVISLISLKRHSILPPFMKRGIYKNNSIRWRLLLWTHRPVLSTIDWYRDGHIHWPTRQPSYSRTHVRPRTVELARSSQSPFVRQKSAASIVIARSSSDELQYSTCSPAHTHADLTSVIDWLTDCIIIGLYQTHTMLQSSLPSTRL